MSDDWISTARLLATSGTNRPKQVALRRAISTAYYAVFHALARMSADVMAGTGEDRPKKAWTHVYRSLNHGFAKDACIQVKSLGFPNALQDFANAFVALQTQRHAADYDPGHRLLRSDVMTAISQAEGAIAQLAATPRKHQKAFAVQVLLKKRRT